MVSSSILPASHFVVVLLDGAMAVGYVGNNGARRTSQLLLLLVTWLLLQCSRSLRKEDSFIQMSRTEAGTTKGERRRASPPLWLFVAGKSGGDGPKLPFLPGCLSERYTKGNFTCTRKVTPSLSFTVTIPLAKTDTRSTLSALISFTHTLHPTESLTSTTSVLPTSTATHAATDTLSFSNTILPSDTLTFADSPTNSLSRSVNRSESLSITHTVVISLSKLTGTHSLGSRSRSDSLSDPPANVLLAPPFDISESSLQRVILRGPDDVDLTLGESVRLRQYRFLVSLDTFNVFADAGGHVKRLSAWKRFPISFPSADAIKQFFYSHVRLTSENPLVQPYLQALLAQPSFLVGNQTLAITLQPIPGIDIGDEPVLLSAEFDAACFLLGVQSVTVTGLRITPDLTKVGRLRLTSPTHADVVGTVGSVVGLTALAVTMRSGLMPLLWPAMTVGMIPLMSCEGLRDPFLASAGAFPHIEFGTGTSRAAAGVILVNTGWLATVVVLQVAAVVFTWSLKPPPNVGSGYRLAYALYIVRCPLLLLGLLVLLPSTFRAASAVNYAVVLYPRAKHEDTAVFLSLFATVVWALTLAGTTVLTTTSEFNVSVPSKQKLRRTADRNIALANAFLGGLEAGAAAKAKLEAAKKNNPLATPFLDDYEASAAATWGRELQHEEHGGGMASGGTFGDDPLLVDPYGVPASMNARVAAMFPSSAIREVVTDPAFAPATSNQAGGGSGGDFSDKVPLKAFPIRRYVNPIDDERKRRDEYARRTGRLPPRRDWMAEFFAEEDNYEDVFRPQEVGSGAVGPTVPRKVSPPRRHGYKEAAWDEADGAAADNDDDTVVEDGVLPKPRVAAAWLQVIAEDYWRHRFTYRFGQVFRRWTQSWAAAFCALEILLVIVISTLGGVALVDRAWCRDVAGWAVFGVLVGYAALLVAARPHNSFLPRVVEPVILTLQAIGVLCGAIGWLVADRNAREAGGVVLLFTAYGVVGWNLVLLAVGLKCRAVDVKASLALPREVADPSGSPFQSPSQLSPDHGDLRSNALLQLPPNHLNGGVIPPAPGSLLGPRSSEHGMGYPPRHDGLVDTHGEPCHQSVEYGALDLPQSWDLQGHSVVRGSSGAASGMAATLYSRGRELSPPLPPGFISPFSIPRSPAPMAGGRLGPAAAHSPNGLVGARGVGQPLPVMSGGSPEGSSPIFSAFRGPAAPHLGGGIVTPSVARDLLLRTTSMAQSAPHTPFYPTAWAARSAPPNVNWGHNGTTTSTTLGPPLPRPVAPPPRRGAVMPSLPTPGDFRLSWHHAQVGSDGLDPRL